MFEQERRQRRRRRSPTRRMEEGCFWAVLGVDWAVLSCMMFAPFIILLVDVAVDIVVVVVLLHHRGANCKRERQIEIEGPNKIRVQASLISDKGLVYCIHPSDASQLIHSHILQCRRERHFQSYFCY